MKIVYLVNDVEAQTGITQKVKQNAKQWVALEHEVFFISLKTLSVFDQNMDLVFKKKIYKFSLGRLATALNLLISYFYLFDLVKFVSPDLIYTRYLIYTPFINRVMKKYKVVMEINGDDLVEYKLKSRMTYLYNLWTRDFLLNYVDGFVCVSRELKEKFNYLCKPIIVIANGVDVDQFEIKKARNKRPVLVFIVSSNESWHGLDKVVRMSEYYQDFDFYIIGLTGCDRSNLKYFGPLSQKDSTAVIQQCDVGIGTLSLYKKGLEEASPLKTRQYLSCGLPIIYAYEDTDIDQSSIFSLRLENTENNIDDDVVRDFVLKVFNNEEIRNLARKYAENFLSYQIKEKERLIFFKEVMSEQ
jgi:glycosyltransferase involved in cell wall biosynthesis